MPDTKPKYYVMRNTTSGGKGHDCLSHGVANEHGEFLTPGRNDENVSHAYALKVRRRPLGDWIAIVGGWLVLSEQATRLFNHFTVCKSVRWIPLTVHDRNKKPVLEGTLIYGPKRWDVLDLLRSEYKFYSFAPEVIDRVYKWVLRHGDIPPFDAFYTRELRWIVTARLHDAIVENRLTGFEFLAEGERYHDPIFPGFGF